MSKYCPNVTKLIIKFIAREAVPPGGGLASGLEFFGNPERRKQVLESAESKAIQAIQLVKSAPDNPFGNDDESIARELLSQIKKRQLTMRAVDAPMWRCRYCGNENSFDNANCSACGKSGRR